MCVATKKKPNLNLKSECCCSSTLGVLLDAGEPERHVLAGGGHQHVLWIELDALYGARVIAVQHAHLRPVLRVPDVDPTVRRPRDDELRVGREGGLERQILRVEVSREGLQRRAGERVYQPDERPVRRDEDGLSVGTELEPRPVDVFLG